jgi:hypothetical protein
MGSVKTVSTLKYVNSMVAIVVLKQLFLISALNVSAKVMGRNIQHFLRQLKQQLKLNRKQQRKVQFYTQFIWAETS